MVLSYIHREQKYHIIDTNKLLIHIKKKRKQDRRKKTFDDYCQFAFPIMSVRIISIIAFVLQID